jgi:hypothetical protein
MGYIKDDSSLVAEATTISSKHYETPRIVETSGMTFTKDI